MSIENAHNEQKELKYQELLDVTNAVIFQLDLSGHFIALNSEWEQITGCTIKESIGTHYSNYVASNSQELVQSLLGDLVEGRQEGIHQEIQLLSKQGEVIDVHLFLRADADPNGTVRSLSGTFTDLSSRRASIHTYLENEGNFRFISENMTDMIAVLAEDGLVLYASPSHTTVLGRKLDEYIGSYPIQYMHPDEWEKVFHSFHEAVTNWSEFEMEYRCAHANGHWIDIEMRGKPIKGSDGKTQVIVVSRDITLRKKAEDKLRQTTAKLTTLIASLPFGIKVEDEQHHPLLVNDAFKDIFKPGHAVAESDGSAEGPQEFLNEAKFLEQDPVYYAQQKNKIMDNRQTVLGEEFYLRNGTIIERDAVPIVDHDRFEGYLWIYKDITENKKAEQHLREANQLLQNLSMVDGLTGVANRRCFDEALEKAWDEQTDVSGSISLLLLDIDHFKAFNDLYGHQAGDACLKQVGQALNRLSSDAVGLAARYGGEEFVVLLPGKSADEAKAVAETIMKAIEALRISHKGSTGGDFLTLSIGITTKIATPFADPSILITEADKALYEAKKNGRNQLRVYE